MLIDQSKLFKEFFTKCEIREIKFIVFHHIAAKDITCAISELKKHQVSSHYIIDLNGKIYQLIDERHIAHHAGHSYWKGYYEINKFSIGIEFFNPNPFSCKFTDLQIENGLKLVQKISKKYQIQAENIIGHSDIAYFAENEENKLNNVVNFLNRKQDPSHLFDWEKFAKHGFGRYFRNEVKKDKILFKLGEEKEEIKILKKNLNKIGYKITYFDQKFDNHLSSVIICFNRHFNQENYGENCGDFWLLSSDLILKKL